MILKESARRQPDTPLAEDYSFSDVVDEACEKLKDRQIKYSIRRIQEMEEVLCTLEKELDNFLLQKDIIKKTDNVCGCDDAGCL